MFNFNIVNTQISPLAIFIQVTTAVLIPVMASLYPFLANLRFSAAEALSIFGQTGSLSRKNLIDRLLSGPNIWFFRRILARPIVLSLRNTFRSKGRLVLTLITLSMAGAIFIGVFNVRASIFDTLDALMKLWHFDVMVNFDNNYPVERIVSEAKKMAHVTSVDVWIQFPARLVRADGTESEAIYMFAPNAGSDLAHSPEIMDGRWIIPGDENALVVDALFLKNEGYRLGDTLTLKLNGHKFQFKIIGVSMGVAQSMIYGNYPYIAKITNGTGKADTALIAFDSLSGEELAQSVEALQDHYKKQGLHVVGSQTMVDEKSQAQSTFEVVIMLLMIMAALLALVGGLGLMGTMSINVLERTREIGVLRAIGAPNRGVSRVFMQEGILIGIISWFLGTLISVPFSLILDIAVGTPLIGAPLSLSYSYEGACIWLIVVIGLSALASLVPARSASRLTVREVLAYE
jgi:putative ABC transport system permease protein